MARRYFESGLDEVTQQQVREKFGKPHVVKKSLLDKTTTWVYRIALEESKLDPSGLKGIRIWGIGIRRKGVSDVRKR